MNDSRYAEYVRLNDEFWPVKGYGLSMRIFCNALPAYQDKLIQELRDKIADRDKYVAAHGETW